MMYQIVYQLYQLLDIPSTILIPTILSKREYHQLHCVVSQDYKISEIQVFFQMGSGFETFYHLRLSMHHLQTPSSVRSRPFFHHIKPGYYTFESTCKYFLITQDILAPHNTKIHIKRYRQYCKERRRKKGLHEDFNMLIMSRWIPFSSNNITYLHTCLQY